MIDQRFMRAAEAALDTLASWHEVEHADVRVSEYARERMTMRTGRARGPNDGDGDGHGEGDQGAPASSRERGSGLCVRVLSRGAWGVATARGVDEAAARKAARVARKRARDAAGIAAERIVLAEEEPQVGSYATPVDMDPFALAGEQRAAYLERVLAALQGCTSSGAALSRASATLLWQRIESVFCSTAGTRIQQRLVTSGAGLEVMAMGPDGPVRRSWPARGELAFCRAGHEFVDPLDLEARVLRMGEQVLALAVAPPCPADTTTLILGSDQLAVQIRETCARPSLWTQARPELAPLHRLGRVRLGSTLIHLSVDGRAWRGAATAGWDDEGVPARVTPLVSRGVIVGVQTGRATAERSGLGRSSGSMRARWCDLPPGLATGNVMLAPDPRGPGSLDDLIADTDRGILMETSAGTTLDGARHGFACEAAWQIERGKRVRLLRAPLYTATAAGLWRRCDAVASESAFRVLGLQTSAGSLAAGFGCAPARFRDIEVGSRA
jgi:TldD protein